MTSIEAFRDHLETSTGIPFAAMAWKRNPEVDAWGLITITAEAGSVWGDNRKEEQALMGQIHLFTRRPGQADMAAVQDALNPLEIHWRLDAVQYETDKQLVHYTWVWADWAGDLL